MALAGWAADGEIAVLGDMLELDPTEAALHQAIARHPGLQAVHVIHCVGPRMRALYDALPRPQRGSGSRPPPNWPRAPGRWSMRGTFCWSKAPRA